MLPSLSCNPDDESSPMRNLVLAILSAAALAACSRHAPPVGRWEGTYEAGDVMIAARMEVEGNGRVRVSAPDLLGIAGSADEDRPEMRGRLAADLAADWESVAPRPMDFDGETFRKPGGIAPQAIWNAQTKTMRIVVYLGTRPGIQIPMRAVGDFSDDPWNG
jgi:hypothetical protein